MQCVDTWSEEKPHSKFCVIRQIRDEHREKKRRSHRIDEREGWWRDIERQSERENYPKSPSTAQSINMFDLPFPGLL